MRARQLAERMKSGPAWVNSGRVFTHPDGTELHLDSITKRLQRLVSGAGLPWIKLHGLRHTHATLMLEAGVHIKVVHERLGHSSIAITGDVYAHVTPGMQDEAAAGGRSGRGRHQVVQQVALGCNRVAAAVAQSPRRPLTCGFVSGCRDLNPGSPVPQTP